MTYFLLHYFTIEKLIYFFLFNFFFFIYSIIELLRWLDTLARFGVALIKNAALTEDQARKLANRVGFIRKTHYGEGSFSFFFQLNENISILCLKINFISRKLVL